MAYAPRAGTSGKVRYGVGNTIPQGLNRWSLDKSVAVVKTTHFDTTADANGVVWNTYLKSLGDCKGEFSGYFDTDTTNSEEAFPIGTTVTLDLLFDATGPLGYVDLSAIITGISPSDELEGVGAFRCSFQISGTPPVAT